jgi:hypothetical protein
MVTVKLRKSRPEELPYFCDIEADADTRQYITPAHHALQSPTTSKRIRIHQ